MAEALAVIGIVSSIVQLVQFADVVIGRVNEFRTSAKEIPATFRDISITLPLLVSDLKKTKTAAESGKLADDEKVTILAVIEGCSEQVKTLDEILEKTLVAKGDSKWITGKKALLSFHQEEKVKSIAGKLQEYIVYLTHHAIVNISHHDQPVKPKVQVVSMVPFNRDAIHFIGRQRLIDAVKDGFVNHERVALVGLGGVGKSQIAVEYSYILQDQKPNISIFWVHVSSRSRFKQSFAEIARKVQLPKIEHPESDALQEVTDWLCDESNGEWLLILDNRDDIDVLLNDQVDASGTSTADNKDGKPLIEYIPQTRNGSILITSRNREVALALTNQEDECLINVDSMDSTEAIKLLRSKIPNDKSPEKDALALVDELGCLPLAIKQAAAYIVNGPSSMTISKYLQYFRKNEKQQEALLLKDFHDLTRDHDLKNSIILTWQLSFDQISNRNPAAADLLALLSFLDRQSIPRFLICPEDEEMEFDENIAPLINFSLITETADECYTMHRLVQITTQKWIQKGKRKEQWQEEALQVVSGAFPNGDFENWTQCEILYPHAQLLTSHKYTSKPAKENLASLLLGVGLYDKEQGRFEAAHRNISNAHILRKELFGEEHDDTNTCLDSLGSVLEKEGKYHEAVAMHRESLALRQKISGSDDVKTLESISNLGFDLINSGNGAEAEKMLKGALERYSKVIGEDHQSILRCRYNVGEALLEQGSFQDALDLCEQLIKDQTRVLRAEHPHTLDTFNNLGLALGEVGKLEEAEALLLKTMKIQEKVLGPEHPNTLTTLNNYCVNLGNQGKFAQAVAMTERLVEIQEKVVGYDHPETNLTCSNLGHLYMGAIGRQAEALPLFQRAYESNLKTLGKHHQWTWEAQLGMARCYEQLGRLGDSIALNRSINAEHKIHLGPHHFATLTSMNNLALVLGKAKQLEEAESLFRELVEIEMEIEMENKQRSNEGPKLALPLSNLADVLFDKGDFGEAEQLRRRSLGIHEKNNNTTEAAIHRSLLARVLFEQGKVKEAEREALRGNEVLVEAMGWENHLTLLSAHVLGISRMKQGKYLEAEDMARRAYEGRRDKFKPDDQRIMNSALVLLVILQATGKTDEAAQLVRDAKIGKGELEKFLDDLPEVVNES